MPVQNKTDLVNFKIKRIKEISFAVNERLFVLPTLDNIIQCRLNCEFNFNVDFNSLFIDLQAFYYYQKSLNEEQLANIKVQNIFEVIDLKKYFVEGELLLPAHFIVTIMSMSIAHTRALFSKNTDGTAFGNIVMPIINPTEFSKTLFPKVFETESVSKNVKQNKRNTKSHTTNL